MARSRSGGLIFLLLFLMVLALLWIWAWPQIMQAANAVASQHALDGHAEAEQILACINSKGPENTLRDIYDRDKFYLTCTLPDGRIGLAPFVKKDGKLYNKTAFVPKDGTLKQVWDYLHGIATKYTGPLPPFAGE